MPVGLEQQRNKLITRALNAEKWIDEHLEQAEKYMPEFIKILANIAKVEIEMNRRYADHVVGR